MGLDHGVRPLARCIRCRRNDSVPRAFRTFSTTVSSRLETESQQTPSPDPTPPPSSSPAESQARIRDPNRVSTFGSEQQLVKNQRLTPIGSRRRRAAIGSTTQVPFSELPYQCFQEARAILRDDRNEKLEMIQEYGRRIEQLRAKEVPPQDEARKEKRLEDMRRRLEQTKILADINDPLVKKKFEDGDGEMTKPIYRYLSDKLWRKTERPILLQRITQMNVIPDVLPSCDPIVSTKLVWIAGARKKKSEHGEILSSLLTEQAPNMFIQPYDQGKKLYTVAVMNPDVPDVSKDGFSYRCHFLAVNIPVEPTDTLVKLGRLTEAEQVVLPWLPAYAQKGLKPQRMSVLVFEQPKDEAGTLQPVDIAAVKSRPKYTTREAFNIRSFATKFMLKPVGLDLFRTTWDEGTAGVMQKAGIPGWDVEFKRKIVEPLPYQRKDSERYR